MNTSNRRRLLCIAALASTLAGSALAQAQPAQQAAAGGRTLTIVVPYAGGGAADPVVRPLAQRLQERLGRPVIVDNKPGANGLIGTQHLLRLPADGNTIMFHITSLVQNLALSRGKPPYDFNQDLNPLVLLGRQSVVLVVPGTSPSRSFQELARAAKASPAQFAYGSYGSGSTSHIYGEALRAALGIEMPHVAFKGTAPLVQEMLGGRIPMAFVSAATAVERDADKSLRAVAVAAPRRLELLPQVPTLAELGYPGFESTGWWGLFIKAGTPPSASEPLLSAIRAVLQEPDMRARLKQAALEPSSETPEQIAAGMRTDYQHWEALSRRFNITAD
jgi:tripartite-type tricarboxylate transporter receptor subunit TctC